jgi:iron complex transport system ATP-binding protein
MITGMMTTGTLSTDSVTVRLKGRTVVDHATVSFAPGGLIALVGPNGAGKSTLLKTLAGLITPDTGTIRIGNQQLREMPAAARARAIAYLPQSRIVHWPLPVRNIVALGRLPYGHSGGAETPDGSAAIDAAMSTMDVAQFSDRPILELSGGEQARVLMARALAQSAPILLADEPTASLDPAHQLHLFDALQRTANTGATVVVATHDLSLAARYCRTVVVMDHGRIVAHGPPDTALSEAILAQVYGIKAKATTIEGVPVIVPLSAQR